MPDRQFTLLPIKRILLFLFFPSFLFGQIPNGSFENWAMSSEGFNEPTGWITNNFNQYGEDYISVFQDTISLHNSSSIALTANALTEEGRCPGVAKLSLKESDFPAFPTSLNFWVKCEIPDLNSRGIGKVYIWYYKDESIIEGPIWKTRESIDDFIQIKLPMEPIEFDEMIVFLEGGSFRHPLGCRGEATMWIDLLEFEYLTSNTNDLNTTPRIEVFPNPVNTLLHIRSNSPVQSYRIFDLKGKAIQTQQVDGNTNDFSVAVNQLPKGMYLLELLTKDQQKIVKKITKH